MTPNQLIPHGPIIPGPILPLGPNIGPQPVSVNIRHREEHIILVIEISLSSLSIAFRSLQLTKQLDS
jgi:hypothetical protein